MEQPERLSQYTDRLRESQQAIDLMRFLSVRAMTRGSMTRALDLFEERWPDAPYTQRIRLEKKAAVVPGGTVDPSWAGALIRTPDTDPLVTGVRRDSVLGRLGAREVPFAAHVPASTSIGTFAWASPTTPKPVTKINWASLYFPAGTLAGIVVLTAELVKLQSPGSTRAMQAALTGGITAWQDRYFLDPQYGVIADVRPKAITNGITPIAGSANFNADVAALLAAHFAAWPESQRPTLIMTPGSVSRLAPNHPTLTVAGGTAFGVPVVPSPAAGAQVIALDAAALAFADGGLQIDVSTEATVEMSDTPSAPGPTIVHTSFWQLDLAGYRVERMLWYEALPNSVQVVTTS